mmetsp:Transcript_39910/g.56241  ORF Transcript_39910/g.56241 Transcript_39910/m.56241 type:complete len:452 (+) Transcript_39910:89-1444(+)
MQLRSAYLLLILSSQTSAFTTPSPSFVRTQVTLFVKTKKKAGKKKGIVIKNSSGFGQSKATASKPKNQQDNDFSAFPALEDSVQGTLVPAEGSSKEGPASDLSNEMYQRLGEIYGFKSFNYLLQEGDKEETPSVSFGDLLSTGGTKGNPSPAPISDLSDLLNPSSSSNTGGGNGGNLADLIASATGGTVEKSSSSKAIAASTDMKIDSLPAFEKFRVLHVDPMVLLVEDFFTAEECDKYIALSENPSKGPDAPMQSRSKTVGKDALAKAQRTSTTWFHHYKTLPELMAKASRLFGLDGINRWEEPQTVRYRRNEKFTWHLDALAPSNSLEESGGQRLATLLVYLTDLTEEEGGATMFRDLGGSDGPLRVRPKKGSALLFFPAAGGIPNVPFDIRTLHCGEAVAEHSQQDKWISQLWLRQRKYTPTAPAGNSHAAAVETVAAYCSLEQNQNE